MKTKIFILIIIFYAFSSLDIYSQTVDEVLSKYTEAIGGKANWDKIKSLKYTGYVSVMNMDIPYTQYAKRPGMWYHEMQVQGMKIIQSFDGKTGWMINPMLGSKKPEKTDDDITKSYKANSLMGGKLMNIKEMDYTVELIGTEQVDGKEVYNLKLTDKDGEATTFYIETSTFYIYKTISKKMRMGSEMNVETVFSNYTKVNDVMIPFIADQKIEGGQNMTQVITVDKVEVNGNIDDKIFVMPAE